MAFIPIPNCAKLVLEFTRAGVPVVLTFGICKGSAPSVQDLTDAGTEANTWWQTELRPKMTPDITLQGARVTDLTTQTSPEVFVPKSSNNVGTNAGAATPSNAAIGVQFETALRGRSYRGTSYFFGFPTADMTDARTIDPADIVALITSYALFQVYMFNAGWSHVVLSRVNNGVVRTTGVGTDVTGYSAGQNLDDMGRRLR